MFIKKAALKNFANFTGKRLCRRHFFNKVECGLQLYLKWDSDTEIYQNFKNTFFTEHLLEAALHSCSHKKVFWNHAANLQESTHVEALAVKLEITHKPAKPPTNHPIYPQTSRTTQKPPTIHPNHPQTTLKPTKYQDKSPTN